MNEKLRQWRKEGNHLPEFMRDFHDQKDLFKAMHEMTDTEGYVDWIKGQCYVIDIFLWFMARHGYTLQKSRAKLDFENIHENVEECRKQRLNSFSSLIMGAAKK